DSLSYVLGTPEIEIDEISLLNSNALLYIAVPDTRTAEALAEALNANSHCEWRPPEFGGGRQVHPGKQMVTLFGKWKTESAPVGSGARPTGRAWTGRKKKPARPTWGRRSATCGPAWRAWPTTPG